MYIGLAALLYPIYLDQYDIYGIEVSCGNALRSDLSQAARADRHGLATLCGTALLVRRAWAIPAVAIGWLLVTEFLTVWVRIPQSSPNQSPNQSRKPHPPEPNLISLHWTVSAV
jgi:hypothetical protein